ncbi:MAG: N-acetylglucosamine-6-phosphate deacetylase [Clostridia bacterium]
MRIANGITYVEGKLQNGVEVAFQNGVITAMGAQLPAEPTIDATGCIVTPGFIDIHIHGFAGHDAMEGEDAVRIMAKALPKHGTTSFLATTMTASVEETRTCLAGIARVVAQPGAGANVLGAFMEGPYFCEKRKGAQPGQYLAMPSLAHLESMTGENAKVVRMISVAPELEGALEFIRALSARGVTVACGHTDATCEQVMEAVRCGASEITHLFNGMSALHHREPGVPGAALTCKQLSVELIADLIHLHPTALRLAYTAKGADRCVAITDSMMAGGMPDGIYSLGGQTVIVKENAARLENGVLAGSTLTLDRSLRNMVSAVGVPLEDALKMYTANPARQIGETRRGTLQVGHFADLLLLDAATLAIKAVYVGGMQVA